jgi:hypothetical protein
MAKTREVTMGDKTFVIREKMPMKLIKWATKAYKELEALRVDDGVLQSKALDLNETVFSKMVVGVKVDGEYTKLRHSVPEGYELKNNEMLWSVYLEDEADEDDFSMSLQIVEDLGEVMKGRFDDLKLKQGS